MNREKITWKFYKFYKQLEESLFIYFFMHLPANSFHSLIGTKCKQLNTIFNDQYLNADEIKMEVERELKNLITTLNNRAKNHITKENFFEIFKELSYSDQKNVNNKYLLYVLTRIQTIHHQIKITDLTIEHVLPKKSRKWGFSKKEIVKHVDKIGNLTTVSQKLNSKINNDEFFKKQEIFKEEEVFSSCKRIHRQK